MRRMTRAFVKNIFGADYNKTVRTLLIDLVIFWGLRTSGLRVEVAPFILYLTVAAFTAGVIWQTLSSTGNEKSGAAASGVGSMRNQFMLPFDGRKLIFTYIGTLGAYTLLTKTAALLAVLLAVSDWSGTELAGYFINTLLTAGNAVLTAGAVFSTRQHGGDGRVTERFRSRWICRGVIWGAFLTAAVFLLGNTVWFPLALAGNGIAAVFVLWKADPYTFYVSGEKSAQKIKGRSRHSVWIYFIRYMLLDHRNYMINTVGMWGLACVLPIFFRQTDSLFAAPLGYAVLSLNTPVCILLSCDPSLEQAVRFLPGQRRAFCVPYCLFVFSCNMAADLIFLLSWRIQTGEITVWMAAAAAYFALQSAVFSVLLEWFFTVRGWQVESDLWHHPRKYLVPAVMMLIAGLVSAVPKMLWGLLVISGTEIVCMAAAWYNKRSGNSGGHFRRWRV